MRLDRRMMSTASGNTTFSPVFSSGNAFRTASQSPMKPRFSGEHSAAGAPDHLNLSSVQTAQAARQLGLIKAGRILWEHFQHADNREEIKAMGQYFLPRLAKYGTALIPFGFLLAGPVDWWAGKHVERGKDKIEGLI